MLLRLRTVILTGLLITLCGKVNSEELSPWSLVIPLTSWHNEDKPYNEKNYGFGIQYDINNNFSAVMVRYPNSFDRWTTGVGFPYSPSWSQTQILRIHIKPSIAPTFFKGYDPDGKWILVPIPSVDLMWDKRWGINVISDLESFVGFSLKFNAEGM